MAFAKTAMAFPNPESAFTKPDCGFRNPFGAFVNPGGPFRNLFFGFRWTKVDQTGWAAQGPQQVGCVSTSTAQSPWTPFAQTPLRIENA